jgi:ABC-type dipeptide/oligopeptide/nickel transport system permease component
VQAVVFFSAAFIVAINILVDVAYAWLDPRIRVAG